MKKILLLVSSSILLVNSFCAQTTPSTTPTPTVAPQSTTTPTTAAPSEAESKLRFGLRVNLAPTWLRSKDKYVDNDATKFGYGFGLQMERRITPTTSFLTGIVFDFLGGKQSYLKGQGYVLNKDMDYTESTKTNFTNGASSLNDALTANGEKAYEIKNRTIKSTYVTIPLILKLMTKDINSFRYYGLFGGNIAIQTKFSTTDEINELVYNSTTSEFAASSSSIKASDLRPKGDLIPLNIGLNAGFGLEYNLSGSTSLFASINYLRGFINQYQPTSDIIVDDITESIKTKTKATPSKQSAFVDGIQLSVGILF